MPLLMPAIATILLLGAADAPAGDYLPPDGQMSFGPSSAAQVVPVAYQKTESPGNTELPRSPGAAASPPASAHSPAPAGTAVTAAKGSPTAGTSPTQRPESVTPLGEATHNRSGSAKPGSLPALISIGGSLAVVVGVFLLFAWLMRKSSPRGSLVLPGEVFEVLGRAPLAARQQVHLLRCGRKLLLVSVTPGGTETLTEVTDAEEVDRLAGLCRKQPPPSATTAFRQVFHQVGTRTAPADRGWETRDA